MHKFLCAFIWLFSLLANGDSMAQTDLNTTEDEKEQMTIYRDIEFADFNGVKLLLDLYMPEEGHGPYPVIVHVHGGAYREGDRTWSSSEWIVQHGYAYASIDHRLSPEHPFPAHLEDCKAAVRWLRAHAEKYNLDPNRVGAWGSSSGGHLVNLLGTTGEVDEFDIGDHLEFSSRVQAVCSSHGACDLKAFMEKRGISPDDSTNALAQFLGGPLGENQSQIDKANPIQYITDRTPPFLLIHGRKDDIVPFDQSEIFYKALKAKGIAAILHAEPTGVHCYDLDTNLTEEVRAARQQVLRFFDIHLKASDEGNNNDL